MDDYVILAFLQYRSYSLAVPSSNHIYLKDIEVIADLSFGHVNRVIYGIISRIHEQIKKKPNLN